MNLRQVFQQTSDATLKGRAISVLAAGRKGANQTAVLDLTAGNLADQDVFNVGVQPYEIHLIAGAEAAVGTTADATSKMVTFDVSPTPALVKGEVFRLGTEFVRVLSVDSPTSYQCERGFAGSTAAQHTNATVKRRAQAPSLGVAIPVSTLISASADTEIANALNYWLTSYRSPVRAAVGNEAEVLLAMILPLHHLRVLIFVGAGLLWIGPQLPVQVAFAAAFGPDIAGYYCKMPASATAPGGCADPSTAQHGPSGKWLRTQTHRFWAS